MKNSLAHLPLVKQQELQAIVAGICVHSEVEMIILFGSYARGDWVEDMYEEDGKFYRYQSDYDLLVIVKSRTIHKQRRLESDFENIIDELRPVRTPVSIIVHDIHYINMQLDEAQYFFSDIKKEGILLHSTNKVQLKEPTKQLSPQRRYELAQEEYEYWAPKAVNFYETFQFCLNKGNYCEAAFLLHQTVERFYITILLVFTHYKPKTHDLKLLRMLANGLDQRLIKIFPLATPEEKRLFRLLRDAYIGARYKKNYVINKEELLWLEERVNILHALTEALCTEKMQSFLK